MNERVFTNMIVALCDEMSDDVDLGKLTRALTAKYVQHIQTND